MEYIHLFYPFWEGCAKINAQVEKVKVAVEVFKTTGVFNITTGKDEAQSQNEGSTTDSPVEVVIKKEKDDDKENIESAGVMPPSAKRVRGRPKKKKEEIPVIDILDSSTDQSKESSSFTMRTRSKTKKTKTYDERNRDLSNYSEDAVRLSKKINAEVEEIQVPVQVCKTTGVFNVTTEKDEAQSQNEGVMPPPVKRKRGRPKKIPVIDILEESTDQTIESSSFTKRTHTKKEKTKIYDERNRDLSNCSEDAVRLSKKINAEVEEIQVPVQVCKTTGVFNVTTEKDEAQSQNEGVMPPPVKRKRGRPKKIPVIDILEESTDQTIESSSFTKRTHTKKEKTKIYDERNRDLSNCSEDAVRLSKAKSSERTKHKKVNEEESAPQPKELEDKSTDGSLYEDARSTIGSTKSALNKNIDRMDATYVLSRPVNEMNVTVIIDKNKELNNETVTLDKPTVRVMNETIVISKNDNKLMEMNNDEIMTEDESISPKEILNPCALMKPSSSKQIFNPYDNGPVKKRLEAFERISSEQERTRVTRIKKDQDNGKQSVSKFHSTPLKTTKIPTSVLSSTKTRPATITPLKTSMILSEKSKSALKLSRDEFIERELKRKLEAEEKRRKREERHIKAQKIREEEERKKQKLLKERLLKEQEKNKKMLAEKKERARKKAESEKKRMLAAQQRKKKEKKRQIEEEKASAVKIDQPKKPEPSQQKTLPIFMSQKTPCLPTEDCYDTEDDEYSPSILRQNPWERKGNSNLMLTHAKYAGHKVKHTLFCTKATTPNLLEIFPNIDPQKLKRSSSAIWQKPPRLALLPISEQSIYNALHGD